jgi:hypothetical protein
MSSVFQKNDRVRVRRDPSDEWCPASIALVSENGKSIGLWLDGMVRAGDGMILQALPLIVEDDGTIRGLTGDVYTLEKVSEANT